MGCQKWLHLCAHIFLTYFWRSRWCAFDGPWLEMKLESNKSSPKLPSNLTLKSWHTETHRCGGLELRPFPSILSSAVRAGGTGGATPPPPDFGRSVNPIPTGGIMPTTLQLALPNSQIFLGSCSAKVFLGCFCTWDVAWKQNKQTLFISCLIQS